MARLVNQEIFSVGTWFPATNNGKPFTVNEQMLADIVTSFEKLKVMNQRVPLKFGHNQEQSITDGQPAIGWMTNVRLSEDGSKLLADFDQVPEVVANAINNGLYKTVSVEIFQGAEIDGQIYSAILDAVALLGADKPAVENLKDLEALVAMERVKFSNLNSVCFSKNEVDNVDELELEKLKAELAAMKSANAALEKSALEAKAIAKRKEVFARLDASVASKGISPAQRDTIVKHFSLNEDQEIVKVELSTINELAPVKETRGEDPATFSKGREMPSTSDNKRPDELINDRALELVEANKVSYSQAVQSAAMEMHAEGTIEKYRDMNLGG